MNKSECGRLGGLKNRHYQREKHKRCLDRYLLKPKLCKNCGLTIAYEKRRNDFCSSGCSASFNNKGVARNTQSPVLCKCLNCGSLTTNKKYCSYACNNESKWKKKKELIESSNALLPTNCGYGYNPSMAKKYLAETRGRQCEICNNSEWMGKPIPLILDHINGDPEDHRLENVRLVCGNCDMQLPTFAGRNRGKGRKSRGWIDKQHL